MGTCLKSWLVVPAFGMMLLLGTSFSEASDILFWRFSETSGTSAADDSGNGRTGSISGQVDHVTETGPNGGPGALDFLGTDGFVKAAHDPALIPTNSLVLSCDFFLYNFPTSPSPPHALISKGGFETKSGYELIVHDFGAVEFVLWIGGSSDPDNLFVLQAPIKLREWYHAKVVWDGKKVSLRINGEEVDSTTSSVNGTPMNGSLVQNTNPFFVGQRDPENGPGFVDGIIDEVRVSTLPPAIFSLSPSNGPTDGFTTVTIDGNLFAPGATVKFGTGPATEVVIESSTRIRCKTPAMPAGAVDVVVTNPDGQSSILAGGFSYNNPSDPNNPTPKIDSGPTFSPDQPIENQEVTFTVSASDGNNDPLTISWTFGDGSTGTGATVAHTYATPDDYNVTVQVSDGNSSVSKTIVVSVIVDGVRFTAGPDATPNPVAVNSNVQFSATATEPGGSAMTYAWDFGDGVTGTGGVINHAYAAAGSFTATVTATGGGQSASKSVIITVSATGGVTIDLVLLKVSVKLNFKKSGADNLLIKGQVTLPDGFDPDGTTVDCRIGEIEVSFLLDSKGKAKTDTGGNKLNKFKLNVKKGLILLKMKKRDFQDAWRAQGLLNEGDSGVQINVPVSIGAGNNTFIGNIEAEYSGNSGKSGKITGSNKSVSIGG